MVLTRDRSRHNARSCITSLLKEVNRVFPEFADWLAQFHNAIGQKILSFSPEVNATIMGKRLDTSLEGPDMLTRLREL